MARGAAASNLNFPGRCSCWEERPDAFDMKFSFQACIFRSFAQSMLMLMLPMLPFILSAPFLYISSLSMSCSSNSSPCCPPGSWDAPLNPTGPTIQPRGQLATIGDKSKTPVYYVCGESEQEDAADQASPPNKSKSGIIVFPDVWGLKNQRTQLICDTFASSNNCHHVVLFDPFRGETKADHDDELLAEITSGQRRRHGQLR